MNATEEIWKEYHSELYDFIQYRITDKSVVEDILQDVFIKIYRYIDTLKDNSKVRSWIYQVTRNTIIDYYRKHQALTELPEKFAEPALNHIDDARRELTYWLFPFIEELPHRYRQTLILSEVEGLTQKEVADRLGISLSGAKSRVQKGRKLIKNLMLNY